ncbi:MAG TPA: acyl-CoA desaturase [Solirubrobacteraceae bacterium]|nr:acyl-CoA desaturase [Solirubrobacteraceae bacterium]
MALAPTADDVQPVANETRDRIITGTVTVLPVLALGVVAWQLWNDALGWSDVAIFLFAYVSTALAITVGFHRHFTHRAFKCRRWVRGTLAIFGSAAIEGNIISWVADHRKHHAFSDEEGDPHSPHVGHGGGWTGALKGLWHAHVGWLFIHTHRGNRERYAPDLLADPMIRFIDRTFVLWVTVGLLVPFGLGYLIGGSLHTALTGLLWGGLVRMLVVHHVTYSINSLCHFFGRRDFKTGDESRNLMWLAPFTFGESWHNNHHAFPTSYRHGLRVWQLDISAAVIWMLEKLGLAWDVVRISPERQQRKAVGT